MPPFPRNFRGSTDAPLVNYEWTDWVTRVGFVSFNLATTADISGTSYILTTGTQYSDDVYVQASDVFGGDPTIVTYNFDSSVFNDPLFLNGTGYVELSFDTIANTGANTISGALLVHDGSTYTQISDIFTGESKAHGGGSWLMQMAISNKIVKKGQRLRLVINSSMVSSSGTFTNTYGTDPANRTQGTMPFSNSKVYLPSRLEI